MSVEQNKAVVRRFLDEVMGRRNSAAVRELVTPGFQIAPMVPAGPDGVQQFVDWLVATFGQLESTTEDIVAEGDRVVVRSTARGTHAGELFGVPATNAAVSFGETQIYRLEDGRIAERWINWDGLAVIEQIGASIVAAPKG